MATTSEGSSGSHTWLGLLLVATLFGLIGFVQSMFAIQAFEVPHPPYWLILVNNLLIVYLWGALVPAVRSLEQRYPLQYLGWLRWLAVHLGASVLFVVVHAMLLAVFQTLVYQGIRILATRTPEIPASTPPEYGWLIWSWSMFWIIVGGHYLLEFRRRKEQEQLRAARLEAQLNEAKLQALQAKLYPHFLFNTLQTIVVLMNRDVESAERMLTRLGELLRFTLDRSTDPIVPLHEELAFLEHYLEIEQIRFSDRLHIDWQVDATVHQLEVPTLIVQPLVENALRHGVAHLAHDAHIEIGASQDGDYLIVWVKDNGQSDPQASTKEGQGLRNVRERLQNLYQDEAKLHIAQTSDGGWLSRVTLPAREAIKIGEAPESEGIDGQSTPLASAHRRR